MNGIMMHYCVKREVPRTNDVVSIDARKNKYGNQVENIGHSNLIFARLPKVAETLILPAATAYIVVVGHIYIKHQLFLLSLECCRFHSLVVFRLNTKYSMHRIQRIVKSKSLVHSYLHAPVKMH